MHLCSAYNLRFNLDVTLVLYTRTNNCYLYRNNMVHTFEWKGKDKHQQLKETIAHQRSLYWMSFRFACVNIAILAYTSSEDIRSRNLHQAKFDTNTPLIVFMQRFIEAVTILTPTRRTPERSIPIFCAPSFFHCQGVSFVSRNDIQL